MAKNRFILAYGILDLQLQLKFSFVTFAGFVNLWHPFSK